MLIVGWVVAVDFDIRDVTSRLGQPVHGSPARLFLIWSRLDFLAGSTA